ncbi:MAG: cytochrome P460 family protein [Bdellovibrionales bacterium]
MNALFLFLAFFVNAHGETFAGQTSMNGISYSDYANFEEKWKFLTVRYRMDTSEQRFVWANASALKTLEAGSTDYPDGAVFAKIGFMTEEDPAFKSSRVPSGALRYQFMVRDKKKYATTGGWGYALFDGNKTTLEGNPAYQAQACYACHQLVVNRGQVFSTPLKISAFAGKPFAPSKDEPAPDVSSVKFGTIPFSKAPEVVRRSLPQVKSIRTVQGKLTAHVFRGTIDEIRPSLVDEAKRSGMPATLIGDDGAQFSAVYPDHPRKNCPSGKSMKAVFSTSVPSSAPDSAPYLVVAWQDLCV